MASNILIKVKVCQSLDQDGLPLVFCLLFVLVQRAARQTLELDMVLHGHVEQCLSALLLHIRVLRVMTLHHSLDLLLHLRMLFDALLHRWLPDDDCRLLLPGGGRGLHGGGAAHRRCGSICHPTI